LKNQYTPLISSCISAGQLEKKELVFHEGDFTQGSLEFGGNELTPDFSLRRPEYVESGQEAQKLFNVRYGYVLGSGGAHPGGRMGSGKVSR
jgi:hypothetical protein